LASDQLLINSVYPVEYFSLPGVDSVQYPDTFWWSSLQRFALAFPGSDVYGAAADGGVPTEEVLEIDLGRIREVNYITMDVLKAPIDIRIEYDAISAPDRTAQWTEARPIDGMPFDDQLFFDAGNRTAWANSDFFFTSQHGNLVHTRYLRLTFARRDDRWPTSTSQPFKWPVMVKHLRMGRYISEYLDTAAPLLTQDTPADLTPYALPSDGAGGTTEVRQRFRVPRTANRGGDVWPTVLGFGVLVDVNLGPMPGTENATEQPIDLSWSLWDVSVPGTARLASGTAEGTYPVGTNWVDWYLTGDDPVLTNPETLYEFRVESGDDVTVDGAFLSGQSLSSTPLPGTFSFTSGSATVTATQDISRLLAAGDWVKASSLDTVLKVLSVTDATHFQLSAPYPGANASGATASHVYPLLTWDGTAFVEQGQNNLVMRVWADVGDEGRDVLGNTYRYGVRREKAAYVVDGTRAGWMSDPSPSKDAVEALYFDLRDVDADTGDYVLRLVDGLRIAPRTPGVRMNVYYSRENLQGERPSTVNGWDFLLWQPLSQNSFVLRPNQVIEFPQPVRAAYVKLEFTDLNPIPWKVPSYPPLPPKAFRRFPTWVEEQFTNGQLRNVVEDWWLRQATPVQSQVLSTLTDPVREFEYKEREFFAALALGEVDQAKLINQTLVNVEDRSVFDPVTASKIWLAPAATFADSLLVSVDQGSILGQMVVSQFDPFSPGGTTERPGPQPVLDTVPTVSSINNRISDSYAHIAQTPMRFNRTTRHSYREDVAEFNKKGFFVGIDEVQFLRNDYTVRHDDLLIQDILHDDFLLELNTWEPEDTTQIGDGDTVYVSYQIGTGTTYYVDEAVQLDGSLPVQLEGKGEPILNVHVFASPAKLGLSYWQNDDWILDHGRDENGVPTHFISRSVYTERLGVPEQPIVYADAAIVVGRAVIPAPPIEYLDAGAVVGVGVISASEGLNPGEYGMGTYGGTNATYDDLRAR